MKIPQKKGPDGSTKRAANALGTPVQRFNKGSAVLHHYDLLKAFKTAFKRVMKVNYKVDHYDFVKVVYAAKKFGVKMCIEQIEPYFEYAIDSRRKVVNIAEFTNFLIYQEKKGEIESL